MCDCRVVMSKINMAATCYQTQSYEPLAQLENKRVKPLAVEDSAHAET